ncbi:MAG: PspC domain-containing protein [Cytophagales bacterium]|nr:PspC domain-containing protein [Cytophagales bacterium]
MKKYINSSINGIIFHIEEDGFEKLHNYLNSIKLYFDHFEDSSEIIEDIENRIAELLLARLSKTKKVITMQDVNELTAIMGSVKDFKIHEDEYKSPSELFNETEEKDHSSEPEKNLLCRDLNKKIIGGVFAGFGHYFNIDPLWFRLVFLLALIVIFAQIPVGLMLLIVYIVLWIILPGRTDIDSEPPISKKLYRDQEFKIISGVSSGIALYLGIDPIFVRLIFIITTFLGFSGFILYIILWIIVPVAKSPSERIQMKGEPVTISNIEANIKKTLAFDQDKQTPSHFQNFLSYFGGFFKELGGVLQSFGQFLAQAFRVVFGISFTFGALALLILLTLLYLNLFGLNIYFTEFHLPFEAIRNTLGFWGTHLLSAMIAIPVIIVLLAGISMLIRKNILKGLTAWILVSLWLLSIIGSLFVMPKVALHFKDPYTLERIRMFPLEKEMAITLGATDNGYTNFSDVNFEIKGYSGDNLKIVEEIRAHGATPFDAMQNAKAVYYPITEHADELLLDSHFSIRENGKFTGQSMELIIYMPIGQPFKLNQEMQLKIDPTIFYRNDLSLTENPEYFVFTSGKKLRAVR